MRTRRECRDWLPRLRWALRGAGLLGCAVAIVVTPELVASVQLLGGPLTPIGVESLSAYRVLALAAGASLLVLAELLPRLALHAASCCSGRSAVCCLSES